MAIPFKAIIIGASSGIGKALALELAKKNYHSGLTGRRESFLHALAAQSSTTCYIKSNGYHSYRTSTSATKRAH